MAQKQKLPDLPERAYAVTAGDPAGIGPDVTARSLPIFLKENLTVVVFWTAGEKSFRSFFPQIPENVHFVDIAKQTNLRIPESGKPDKISGQLAFKALESAVEYMLVNKGKGLLTAPLSKEHVMESESDFNGHTGYLARKTGCQVVMLMHGQSFSVIPITEHVPIVSVADVFKQKFENPELPVLIQSILNRFESYRNARVAICGLNPHCGENGKIGSEEVEIIKPILERWKKEGLGVDGPISADSLFQAEILKKYRLILSCYHDQGLIPFKSIEGKNGVNVTVGLPFLRTSPDHGTAFSIAGGQNIDATSMIRAAEFLIQEAEK